MIARMIDTWRSANPVAKAALALGAVGTYAVVFAASPAWDAAARVVVVVVRALVTALVGLFG